jgi:hypothetical protein
MYSRNLKTVKIIDFGSAIFYENSDLIERKRIGTVIFHQSFSLIIFRLRSSTGVTTKNAIFGR